MAMSLKIKIINLQRALDSGDCNRFNTRHLSTSCVLARIAQSVEQRIENPRVGGSIPPPGTIIIQSLHFTAGLDRKSTRLNSSHVRISYAVFCLKKKKKKTT